MRVRKRKGAEEHLANNPHYVILNPEDAKGRWHDVLEMTVLFISKLVQERADLSQDGLENPDINYIGIDIQLSVLSYALDKVLASEVPNVKLLRVDGSSLTNYFEDGEVDMMYLNFSDPWPKNQAWKRRLTYKDFLDTYKRILPEHGEIHFKTDNRGLFEYSLASFSQYGMTLRQIWLDLHASNYEGNVMTEYEEKFSNKGQVIYRVEANF